MSNLKMEKLQLCVATCVFASSGHTLLMHSVLVVELSENGQLLLHAFVS